MNASRLRVMRFWVLAGLLICLMPAGCSDSTPAPSVKPAEPTTAQPQAASAPVRETWDITYMMGSRVGYTQTTVRHVTQSGRKLVQIEAVDYIDVKRFGDRARPSSHVRSTETLDGKLIVFENEMLLGSQPTRTTGRVEGDRLELEMTSLGKRTTTSIPWSAEYGGPFTDAQSLRREVMRPGGRRTIRVLAAGFNQPATVEMNAKDYEPVRLPTGTRNLLRIESLVRLADGKTLSLTSWCDREGETLKVSLPGGIEKLRATKTLALKGTDGADRDLGLALTVKVDRALSGAHQTKRIRYRVQLADGDPAEEFVSGPSQQIKSVDPHTAELTVYALRPGQPGGAPEAPDDPPTDDDRESNNWIQSDYPKIVAIARKAAGNRQDPWEVARALERYVGQHITEVAFSQALATAAEVSEKPVGDCTEHAMFLAALARARGIPARVAMGLIYVPQEQAFGYHMWTEVYVQKRWIPVDATLGRGGIGAAHLKLGHSSFKGPAALSSLLPVIQVIRRLKIEVLEVE